MFELENIGTNVYIIVSIQLIIGLIIKKIVDNFSTGNRKLSTEELGYSYLSTGLALVISALSVFYIAKYIKPNEKIFTGEVPF